MPLVIGLDVGTTSAKAVAFTADGEPVGQGRARTPWATTADGVEMAAADLAAAALDALAQAASSAPPGEPVAAIGITSMGESGVLVDRAGRPVAPVIAWHDTRDAAQLAALGDEIGEDDFGATTGKPFRGQFSLTKHRWLHERVPEVATAVRRFNIAEYVVRVLGGEEACELSLASRTGWFDIAARQWWLAGLDYSRADVGLMPPLVQAGDPLGRVTAAEAHPRLGGAVLTVVGHDHQAAAVGVGATELGDEVDSCGTAEALVRTVPATLSRDQIRVLAHGGVTTDWSIHAGRWSLLAATEGGLAMERALTQLKVDRADLPALDQAAAEAPSGRVRVSGIGADALVIDGAENATPPEIWRAVVEAVTDQAVALHRAMAAVAGPHRDLLVTGGWANSAALLRAKDAGFGAYRRSEVYEAGARGAAVFAARAAGMFGPDEAFGEPAGGGA
jgi:sugar (pentulose or hexulose) kinase